MDHDQADEQRCRSPFVELRIICVVILTLHIGMSGMNYRENGLLLFESAEDCSVEKARSGLQTVHNPVSEVRVLV